MTYQRIMAAEERLDARRERLGLHEEVIVDILDAHEPETGEPVEDLYLATVGEYVAALGGHIEVRAIFLDEQVLLLRGSDAVE